MYICLISSIIFFFIGELQGGALPYCDLMPNVLISSFPPSRVDPRVQGLKPQPGSSFGRPTGLLNQQVV